MVKISIMGAVAATLVATVAATPMIEERQVTDGRPTSTTTIARTTSTSTATSTASTPVGTGSAPTSCPTKTPQQITALQQQLLLAASQQDRQAILAANPPDACNYTYQFVNNTVSPPTGGTIALAGVDQFPALVGTKVGAAIGFVNPCGLNVPHSHPRANELLTVVEGSLIAGLILEANPGGNPSAGQTQFGTIPQINVTLSNYRGMLFPQGLSHFQFNPTCQRAVFAAAFDNSDPGRTQIARNFFSVYPTDVLLSATGNDPTLLDASRLDAVRAKIPSSFATLIDSCAKRCGISTSA